MSASGSAEAVVQALAVELGLGSPERVIELMRALYQEVDAEVTAKSRGLGLPCRAGCDACCRESVFLSAPEFLLVVDFLMERWSESELKALLDQMDVLAKRFADEIELLESIEPGPERDEVAARIKFDCPFLAEGQCRIYEVRELNARTFGASWDRRRDEAYGCELTHGRLRVLPPEEGRALAGAREMRAKLVERVEGTEKVAVYPYWFGRCRGLIER